VRGGAYSAVSSASTTAGDGSSTGFRSSCCSFFDASDCAFRSHAALFFAAGIEGWPSATLTGSRDCGRDGQSASVVVSLQSIDVPAYHLSAAARPGNYGNAIGGGSWGSHHDRHNRVPSIRGPSAWSRMWQCNTIQAAGPGRRKADQDAYGTHSVRHVGP
jgi:hypothetical protein